MTIPARWRGPLVATLVVIELIGVGVVFWNAKPIMAAAYQFFDRHLGGCHLTGCLSSKD